MTNTNTTNIASKAPTRANIENDVAAVVEALEAVCTESRLEAYAADQLDPAGGSDSLASYRGAVEARLPRETVRRGWQGALEQIIAERDRSIEISKSDRAAIRSLAEQDRAGDTDDSYARTGDAEDTIRRWRDAAAQAGDRDLVEIIDRVGVEAAAEVYAAARS